MHISEAKIIINMSIIVSFILDTVTMTCYHHGVDIVIMTSDHGVDTSCHHGIDTITMTSYHHGVDTSYHHRVDTVLLSPRSKHRPAVTTE